MSRYTCPPGVDAIDVAILREIGVQPYGASPRPPPTLKAPAIAKRLGLNAERVADRLTRMEESKLLLGYDVYPNYRHLNLDVACYYLRFRDDAAATRAIEEATRIAGIAGAYAFVGGEVNASACGATRADADRKVALLAQVAGASDSRKLYDLVTPPVRRALDQVDWRILQAMRGDALRSADAIGSIAGVSSKTVSRRVERMGEEGAFFVIPEVDWKAAEGLVFAQLWLSANEKAIPSLPRLASDAFRDVLLFHDELIPREGVAETQLVVMARSMRELDGLVERARGLTGVTSARALVFRDAREDYAWLDEAIAGRVRATETPQA